ncbi:MAG: cyanoexosortase A system-associated protein [Scytonema sp. PMC 1069.18]|nr:cyanoexosortase A system-associated protein [Scytonema sp. PMC 1069.18]MEC4885895.1 cyanoexosortase A system-associated protein [Scytonema sp. PMC 1070.18]
MFIWKQLRIPLLAFTCCGVMLVLTRVILLPKTDKSDNDSLIFTNEVPLPQWHLTKNHSLPEPEKIYPELKAQQYYQYSKNQLLLDIEMRYMTEGDVPKLIKELTSVSSSATVRQREGIGYYGVGVEGERAYLSACINPRGKTTFTNQQFNENRFFYETRPLHILSWLLGQAQLQDRRCLWTHLSIPLKNSSPEDAYQVLENAWVSWYQWWRSRFPNQ